MIEYRDSVDGISPERLAGSFEGWPNAPSPERRHDLLAGKASIVLAVDPETEDVNGFVSAVNEGMLSASIALLEVRPASRGRRIGRELVRRVVEGLEPIDMIDFSCDAELAPLHEELGFTEGNAMLRRNHEIQSGMRLGSEP